MKKLYFAIIILFFTKTISAQQYFPMLDSINEWSYSNLEIAISPQMHLLSSNCNYPAVQTPEMSYREFTTTDTVIGSYTYKILMNTLYTPCLMGYVREDTAARKIYFIDNTSSTEKMLYDFSMQVGDTITFNFLSSFSGYVSGLYTLDSISTVQVYAGPRRQFWFACHSSPGSLIFSWVESVGSLSYMAYPYFYNNTMYGSFSSCAGTQHHFDQFLTCFSHSSKVYFDNCAFTMAQNNPCCNSVSDSCDYFSFIGGINELSSLNSMTIFPNPSSGKMTISIDVKHADDFEILVRDISGKKIMKEIPLGKIPEGEKEMEIDLSSFANGFYIVELKTTEGSVYRKLLIQK
jgi:hypothetical protein